ncbi:MAG: T9SS type A sorting domain-containing protein [Saprospiraceae bacterium]|nr:T9SS type A sorting domain-containing protein [Saprospiraceae bacterium]
METIVDMYPNPAKSETTIEVVLPVDGEVRIELFDAASKLIKVIRKVSTQQSGNTLYNVNLEDVAAGVYNVTITIDGIATQKKLIRIE